MSFTKAELQQAERDQKRRHRETKSFGGGDCIQDMQVGLKPYLNAARLNGTECWADDEFVADMKRRHPEIDTAPKSSTVSTIRPSNRFNPKNRAGKVVERTFYHSDGTKTRIRIGP